MVARGKRVGGLGEKMKGLRIQTGSYKIIMWI